VHKLQSNVGGQRNCLHHVGPSRRSSIVVDGRQCRLMCRELDGLSCWPSKTTANMTKRRHSVCLCARASTSTLWLRSHRLVLSCRIFTVTTLYLRNATVHYFCISLNSVKGEPVIIVLVYRILKSHQKKMSPPYLVKCRTFLSGRNYMIFHQNWRTFKNRWLSCRLET